MKIMTKIIIAAVIVCVLAAAFIWGGRDSTPSYSDAANPPATTAQHEDSGSDGLPSPSPTETAAPDSNNDTDATYNPAEAAVTKAPTSTVPPASQALPAPVDTEKKLTCTLSIRCDTVLNNMDLLPESKAYLIPESGYFLYLTDLEFTEHDTVFDILKRELQSQKYHLDFSITPGLGSVYINGIFNLYEFDCGPESGWLFLVNGSSPGISCSDVELSDGCTIDFAYTCNLGKDLGVA